MSGVALGAPAVPQKPSFFRLLAPVLCGYLVAAVALVVFGFAVQRLGVLPETLAHSGPFPAGGAWSLAADLGAATVVVLVAAACVHRAIALAGWGRASFGVVAIAVAAGGYLPLLTFRAVTLVGLLATTWIVQRYAIGASASVLPWRAWVALAVVAFGVFASYRVYHPLAANGFVSPFDVRASGTYSIPVTLSNPGLADVTILRVDGGYVDGPWRPHTLPWTFDGRSQTKLTVFHTGCVPPDVTIRYSVLGVTSTQRFTVGSISSCQR